jgi:2-polyprenyl-3-methyl-5-hydroxy-6-metoxy-1,4-benzoquinol methylase
MTDAAGFWDALCPCMDFLENVLGINRDNLGPIIPLIESPALVVGAGQGLLVEALRRKGFRTEGIDLSPQMVACAARRRGIKLILANADQMPFENGRFKTTIIATGVIDFLNDFSRIQAIIGEVHRVTGGTRKTLCSLHRGHPASRGAG